VEVWVGGKGGNGGGYSKDYLRWGVAKEAKGGGT
jgi:hypothetical protein